MKDFVEFEGAGKFSNVTNGSACPVRSIHFASHSPSLPVTPRRWLDQCNPELSALITKSLGVPKQVWLKDLFMLKKLLPLAEDAAFRQEWAAIKQRNKERLAQHVRTTLGLEINTHAMFDVQIKRLHEYKRQSLNILGVIHRYLTLKDMSAEERKKVNPRVVFFAGKAAPGCTLSSFRTSRANFSEIIMTMCRLHREVDYPAYCECRASDQ